MGRIVTSVSIENVLDSEFSIRCDALVDTGASHLVLPLAWRSRLENFGKLQRSTWKQRLRNRLKRLSAVRCR